MRAARLALVLALVLVPQARAGADDTLFDGGTAAPVATTPPGLYLVNEVYAGDVVTTIGRTTTYGTTTVRDVPGTYARVLASVSTGASSVFDGRSLNARRRLPDGRLVAGTYYEDFVRTAAGYVSVNIVFFQDDALTAMQTAASAAPVPTPAPGPTGRAAPVAGTPPPSAGPGVPRPTRTPIVVTAGVALAETGAVLGRIEVLRGRAVALWPRAFVNGRAVTVTSWRVLEGSGAAVDRTTGGSGPCVAVWLTLPPAGGSFRVPFEVTAAGRTVRAAVQVAVRAPALVQ